MLYVGTKSPSRRMLLEGAGIPYTILPQDANEAQCDWGLPLPKLVESIARHKMAHLILPEKNEGDELIVLTADTLSQNNDGTITGKPINREEAIAMIKKAREGMKTGTAFCLEKKVKRANEWLTTKQIVKYVEAQYVFNVPDEWIDRYFDESIALETAGAIAIECAHQFCKSIHGSYSTIVGLPMYELREALEELNFF